MTFTVTIVSQHGIWQSSDLRLTKPGTRKVEDDFSIKQISFRCPDGAALLTYAGAGRVYSVHISDWIRQFLRGESYTVDQTLIQIREHATRDLGELLKKCDLKHMFSIGAYIRGIPWVAQIRNFSVTPHLGEGLVEHEFQTAALRVPDGTGMVVPWPCILSREDLALLINVSSKRPRKPKEFSDLLAEVNLRTARSANSRGTVSEYCVTTYQPPSNEGLQSCVHNAPAEMKPIFPADLLFGIDVTEVMRELISKRPISEAIAIPEKIIKDTVTPKNLLRRK
jgi:hypothetical protein